MRTRLLVCLVLSAMLAGTLGCRSFTGYPHGKELNDREMDALYHKYYNQPEIEKCLEVLKTKECRNNVVDGRIRAIDIGYLDFERSLNQESVGVNFASDVAVLSLSGAGTLVTGTSTKSVLAALSGVVTGTKSTIDKDVYFAKTLPALLVTMESLRSQKLTEIQRREQDSWENYPLNRALSDVSAYYAAGSIPSALSSISAKASEDKRNADTERVQNADDAAEKSQGQGDGTPGPGAASSSKPQ